MKSLWAKPKLITSKCTSCMNVNLKLLAAVAVMQSYPRLVVLGLCVEVVLSARVLHNNKNFRVSQVMGVYSVLVGFVTPLQSFKCVWSVTHVCTHKAHFLSSPCLVQMFCPHLIHSGVVVHS